MVRGEALYRGKERIERGLKDNRELIQCLRSVKR